MDNYGKLWIHKSNHVKVEWSLFAVKSSFAAYLPSKLIRRVFNLYNLLPFGIYGTCLVLIPHHILNVIKNQRGDPWKSFFFVEGG